MASPPAKTYPKSSKEGTMSRSMTHPLRNPNPKTSQRRVKEGIPFDPAELSRRLENHLAVERVKSQARAQARHAKAVKAEAAFLAAAETKKEYHHVPATAASSFSRTTTTTATHKMHKLSQHALTAHLERVSVDNDRERPGTGLTLLQKTVAADEKALENHQVRNRNQFQWTKEMEEANEVDEERDLYKRPQRTFSKRESGQFNAKSSARPMSTGDLWTNWEEDRSSPPPVKSYIKVKQPPHEIVNDHRNDWAQRDDDVGGKKERMSPFLRKMESSWQLLGKKEKVKTIQRDEGIAGIGQSPPGQSPPEKGMKGGFLARFKRHPN